MKLLWTTVLLAILTCTWGCGPTPYHRAGVDSERGYSDKRLSQDTFHVKFVACFNTPAETLRGYLYRRAAELTLRHGFGYFTVVRDSRPITKYRIEYLSRDDEMAGVDSMEAEVPALGTLHMTIQCFKESQNAVGTSLIDARAYVPKNPKSKRK